MSPRWLVGYVRVVRAVRSRAPAVLGGLSIACIALTWWAFAAEAARRGIRMAPLEELYASLGLFAFSGNRLGFPETWLLTFCYFFAPFLAASALIEAGLRAAESRNPLLLFQVHGHTVICGAGALGTLLAETLEAQGRLTVLVDADPKESSPLDSPYLWVKGDMTRRSTLDAARVATAEQVFLTAGDDLVNLEVAIKLRARDAEAAAGPTVFCHVADGGLRDTLRRTRAARGEAQIVYFNGHQLAAKALVARLLLHQRLNGLHLAEDVQLRVVDGGSFQLARPFALATPVAVVGLGRFGHAVASQLLSLGGRDIHLRVVDRDARAVTRFLDGLSDALRARVTADVMEVEDLRWADALRREGVGGSALLCTDADRANLRVAMQLFEHGVPSVIRMFDEGVGDRLQDLTSAEQIDVAGFRSLFLDALPMLTHRGELLDDGVPVPRIRACVRTQREASGQRRRLWYQMHLTSSEAAELEGRAIDVQSLPWSGPRTPFQTSHRWLVRADDVTGRLSAQAPS